MGAPMIPVPIHPIFTSEGFELMLVICCNDLRLISNVGYGQWTFGQDTDPGIPSMLFKHPANHCLRILNRIDADNLLVERLKTYFTRFYYERVSKEVPSVELELAKYIINFNAYTLLGILKPWLKDGMRHSPEVMAGLLIQLTGSAHRIQAVQRFKNIIK